MLGGISEKKIALIISIAVVLEVEYVYNLTITVSFPDPFKIKYGRRKSDHAAVTAKITIP